MEKGYIHVYTGDGKGKTTAALGLALRAVGRGLRVLVIQFLKGEGSKTGERNAAGRLAPDLEIRPRGPEGFLDPDELPPEEIRRAKDALGEAAREMAGGGWDLVVLDEVNTAVHIGLIQAREVLDVVAGRPVGVELVLTGRYAPHALIEVADLVTEMKEIKHYYRAGVGARKGIES